jgi:hypothetical protein
VRFPIRCSGRWSNALLKNPQSLNRGDEVSEFHQCSEWREFLRKEVSYRVSTRLQRTEGQVLSLVPLWSVEWASVSSVASNPVTLEDPLLKKVIFKVLSGSNTLYNHKKCKNHPSRLGVWLKYGACLARVRPWVQTLGLLKKKKRVIPKVSLYRTDGK